MKTPQTSALPGMTPLGISPAPDYAMFSYRGNQLVHSVVQAAEKQAWDWNTTVRHLALLAQAHPGTASEATDTAVREAVYSALNFSESFYS
jgi:hypothetical protein